MSVHRNPEAERRIQERIETRIAAGQERILRRELNASFRDAAKSYEAGRSIEAAIRDHEQRIERAITDMYAAAFERIGERVAKQLADATGKGRMPGQTKQTGDRFQRALDAFIRRYAAKKITQITSSTAGRIRSVIKSGMEEGLSLDEIGAEIIKVGSRQSAYRAHLIARTETHSAGQAGSLAAAEESGVVRLKEWVPVDDGRTRDGDNSDYDHVDVEPVPVNKPFIVSGEELMHPGDPAGSAGNTIMCRCAMTYTTR